MKTTRYLKWWERVVALIVCPPLIPFVAAIGFAFLTIMLYFGVFAIIIRGKYQYEEKE